MSSVDNRVVKLTFDNSQFEREISRSQTSLGNLDKTIGNIGGKNLGSGFGQGFFGRIKDALYSLAKTSSFAFSGIQSAEASFTTGHMASALDSLEHRFSSMGVIGMSVLDNLGDKFFEIGTKALKALPDAILGGGYKRAQAIENARFTLQGLVEDEKEVEAIMGNAKESVDGTAYAYNDAATAAANFAATGMGSGDQMLHTLQGIAGTAATVNADYSDIAHIFTTIAGNGRVMGEQLNQFSYRGLNAAATVAKSFNEVIDGTSTMNEKAQNRIKSLISENAGDIKNTAKITEEDIRKLASQGVLDFETFGEIMYDRFGEHAKKANDTFTGSMANVRAALARTGEMFFAGLIVQKGPLVKLFNAVRESVNAFNNQLKEAFGWDEHQGAIAWTNFVTMFAEGATTLVRAFTKGGGIEGIGNIIKGIGSVLKPIGDAFDAIFGYVDRVHGTKVSGIQHIAQELTKLNAPFKEFTKTLILNEDAQKKLQAMMEIIFDILKVGAVIIKNILMIAGSVLNVIWKVIGAIADFIGTIFYILNGGRRAVDILEVLSTAIDFLGVVIRSVIRGIGKVIDWVADKLNKFYSLIMGVVDSGSGRVGIFFKSLASNFHEIGSAIRESIDKDSLRPFADYILSKFPKLKQKIEDLHGSLWNFKEVMRIKWQTKGILIFRAKIYQLKKAFGELAEKIAYVLRHLDKAPDMIREKFNNLGPTLSAFKDSLGAVGDTIGEKFGNLKSGFLEKLDAFVTKIKNAFGKIKEFFSGFDLHTVFRTAMTGGFVAYVMYMMKMFRDIVKGIKSFSKIFTLPAKVAGVLTEVKDTLKAYQKEIYANAILKIAFAIGVLAAALWVLSKIPADKVLPAVGVMGALMAELAGAVKVLMWMNKTPASLSINKGVWTFKSNGLMQTVMAMIPIAIALTMVGRVVGKLAALSWDEWTRGILGMTICLGALMGAMVFISQMVSGKGKLGVLGDAESTARFTKTMGSMTLIAGSVWLIGQILAKLGQLSIEQIGKGALAIGAIFAALGAFMKFSDKMAFSPKSAAAIVIVAAALYLLAGAFTIFGLMPWELWLAGLTKCALGLAAIGGALWAFPKEKAVMGAAAFAIVSAALYLLGGAIIFFALIPILTFVEGLLKVCGALIALSFVMKLFNGVSGKGSLKISAALVVLGAALIMLAAGFLIFSKVSIFGIIGGLVALAGVLFVLGMAAMVFGEVVPIIYALCGALALLGLSVALIGGGLALLAWGFVTLGAAGTVGAAQAVAAIGVLLTGITALMPQIAGVFVMGMLTVAQMMAQMAPEFAKAMTDFFYAFHDACGALRVKLKELGYEILEGMADVVIEHAPILGQKLSEASVAIIEGLIPGVQAMGKAMTELVIAMMTSLKDHIVDVTTAGAELAVALVEGIATGIESNTDAMYNAMVHLKSALVGWFKALLGIHSPSTVMAAEGEKIPEGVSDGIQNFIDSGQLGEVMGNLGDALSNGFTDWMEGGGIKNMINSFSNSFLSGMVNMAPGAKVTGEQMAKNMTSGYNAFTFSGWQEITGAGGDFKNKMLRESGEVLRGGELEKMYEEQGRRQAIAQKKGYSAEITSQVLPAILKVNHGLVDSVTKSTAPKAAESGSKVAGDLMNNLISGMRKKSPTVWGTATGAVKTAVSSASNAGSGMSSVGVGLVSGIARGVSNRANFLYTAIRTIISTSLAVAKLAAQVKSPSRLFENEVGQYIPLGIAKGVLDRSDAVENASRKVIENAVSTASILANRLSKAVEDDIDSYPVITPIMDLTDVINKSDDISSMIGGAYAYAMSSNIIANRRRAQDAAALANASSGNVMNQYNNMKIVQQPGESMDVFVNRVVGKLETAANMEG